MGFYFGNRYIENAELEAKNCRKCNKRFINLGNPGEFYCEKCAWTRERNRSEQVDIIADIGGFFIRNVGVLMIIIAFSALAATILGNVVMRGNELGYRIRAVEVNKGDGIGHSLYQRESKKDLDEAALQLQLKASKNSK